MLPFIFAKWHLAPYTAVSTKLDSSAALLFMFIPMQSVCNVPPAQNGKGLAPTLHRYKGGHKTRRVRAAGTKFWFYWSRSKLRTALSGRYPPVGEWCQGEKHHAYSRLEVYSNGISLCTPPQGGIM